MESILSVVDDSKNDNGTAQSIMENGHEGRERVDGSVGRVEEESDGSDVNGGRAEANDYAVEEFSEADESEYGRGVADDEVCSVRILLVVIQ